MLSHFEIRYPQLLEKTKESDRRSLADLIQKGLEHARVLNKTGFEIIEVPGYNLRATKGIRREGNALMFAMIGYYNGNTDAMVDAYRSYYRIKRTNETSSEIISKIIKVPKELVIMVYLVCEREKVTAETIVRQLRL